MRFTLICSFSGTGCWLQTHTQNRNSHFISDVDWLWWPICSFNETTLLLTEQASEQSVLVEVGHGDPPLGLLHHVGLVPQIDVDDGRCQLAGLSIHLHGDGLVGGERHFFTLMESLAVAAHLQGGLDTSNHRSTPTIQPYQISGKEWVLPTHETLRLELKMLPFVDC